MMKATSPRQRDHLRIRRRFRRDRTAVGCILIEAKMAAIFMIVGDVVGREPAQVSLVQDNDVVKKLSS